MVHQNHQPTVILCQSLMAVNDRANVIFWTIVSWPSKAGGSRYLCSGADQSVGRIATSEEGVPAMFGGLDSPDLINAFATNRTKPNMSPPTTVPYITEAGTQSQPSMA